MNESVWDLKQKLAHERNTLKALENSVQRWEEINDDLQRASRTLRRRATNGK